MKNLLAPEVLTNLLCATAACVCMLIAYAFGANDAVWYFAGATMAWSVNAIQINAKRERR